MCTRIKRKDPDEEVEKPGWSEVLCLGQIQHLVWSGRRKSLLSEAEAEVELRTCFARLSRTLTYNYTVYCISNHLYLTPLRAHHDAFLVAKSYHIRSSEA